MTDTPTCSRCGGSGYIDKYKHIAGGECFECNGSGIGYRPMSDKPAKPRKVTCHYLEDNDRGYAWKFSQSGDKMQIDSYKRVKTDLGKMYEHLKDWGSHDVENARSRYARLAPFCEKVPGLTLASDQF